MARRVWLLVVVLGIPAVGFVVADGLRARLDAGLRAAVREQHPYASEAQLAAVSADALCARPSRAHRLVCAANGHATVMRRAAVAAGLVGLGLLLGIRLAGHLARYDRSLLVAVFAPGLRLTILVLIGLVLVDAALVMAAIWYGESGLIERIQVNVVALIGLGALAGVVAMARNVFGLVRKARTAVVGKTLSRAQAPRLWALVEDTASTLGALAPEHLVLGLDPNVFVTEADVTCLDGPLHGRTLYCSLPLCRILGTGELTAIVGHELGHFQGEDTRFSQRFYPIYRGTQSSLLTLRAAGSEGLAAIALLPAMAVLSYFLECFAVAERRLSRDRELAADRAGASVTSADTAATALVKVHAFGRLWNALEATAGAALREGRMLRNASLAYAQAVAQDAGPGALAGVADAQTSHPTDAHPPLAVRLTALHRDVARVATAALDVTPAAPAIALVPDPELLEEELSTAYQLLLAKRLGIDLAEADDRREAPFGGQAPQASATAAAT